MELDFLPTRIKIAMSKLDFDKLIEIRLRINQPISICYCKQRYYLSESGVSIISGHAIICTETDIKHVIDCVTEHSIYAFTDKINNGFLTFSSGIRIGLAGECVIGDGNKIVTIKNFSSLNIRIPHYINGCIDKVKDYMLNNGQPLSTLFISPPLCGKTTMLKSTAMLLDELDIGNILIIDERAEFESVCGKNIDKIQYSDKLFGFKRGIRALSPQFVITDELSSNDDWLFAKMAVNSGIKVFASCHANNISSLIYNDDFLDKVFDLYVVIGSGKELGYIKTVYDKEFKLLCEYS